MKRQSFKRGGKWALTLMLLAVQSIALSAQQKPSTGQVLYAVDIQDNSKVYEMKVTEEKKQAEGYADESFTVERTLVKVEQAEAKGKKKKGLKGLMKELNSSPDPAPSQSRVKPTPPEGEYEYEMTADNTDDDKMMPGQFKLTGNTDPFSYGFFYDIGEGFFKEVFFVNEESDFYYEDEKYFKSIFIVGYDKDATVAKASSMDFSEEKTKYYTPDPKSGRLPNPAVNVEDYSIDLSLDEETGEFELPYTTEFFYLPTKAVEGRNLMYNRDLLRVALYKGSQLVDTKTFSKGHKNGRWLEKVRNQIEVGSRSFGELEAGNYQLRYFLYGNEPFFLADFEVYTIPNPDINDENTEFYYLRGSYDQFLSIDADVKALEDDKKDLKYRFQLAPLVNVLPEGKSEIKSFQAKLFKDGQFFAYQSGFDSWDARDAHLQKPENLFRRSISFISDGDWEIGFRKLNAHEKITKWDIYSGSTLPDGNYKIEMYANDKLFASATFIFKDGKITPEGNSIRSTADPKRYVIGRDDIAYIPLTYHY